CSHQVFTSGNGQMPGLSPTGPEGRGKTWAGSAGQGFVAFVAKFARGAPPRPAMKRIPARAHLPPASASRPPARLAAPPNARMRQAGKFFASSRSRWYPQTPVDRSKPRKASLGEKLVRRHRWSASKPPRPEKVRPGVRGSPLLSVETNGILDAGPDQPRGFFSRDSRHPSPGP